MLYDKGPVPVEENEELLLYTAISSGVIYVVKLFDAYALVRAASPQYYGDVHKIDIMTFTKEFEEYCGDHEMVRQSLFGDDGEQDVELLG